MALGTVTQPIYAIAVAWAWVGLVAVVLAFHTRLGGHIAHLEIMLGRRSWRGFVARFVAVLQRVTLAFFCHLALSGGAIAYVTLFALVGGVDPLAVPVIFALILTTRTHGAVVVDLGKAGSD